MWGAGENNQRPSLSRPRPLFRPWATINYADQQNIPRRAPIFPTYNNIQMVTCQQENAQQNVVFAGVNEAVTQKRTGHKSINALCQYEHVTTTQNQLVANILRQEPEPTSDQFDFNYTQEDLGFVCTNSRSYRNQHTNSVIHSFFLLFHIFIKPQYY